MQKQRKGIIVIATVALQLLFLTGCNKKNQNIPYVPIDATININNPAYIDLNVVGGWEYVTGGSRGILIYRASIDEFRTFDRHSTFEVDQNCQVAVDGSNLIAVDPCSESEFLITDGSVNKGPALLPLQAYQNTFDGTFLRIFN